MDDPETEAQELPVALERFRSYLHLLARMNFAPELRGRLEPSDVVQQTMLEAHRSRALFRGQTFAQEAAWLRQILSQNMIDAARGLRRAKRNIAKEQSLEARLEETSSQLGEWLSASGSSPSEQAMRSERVLLLAEAIVSLTELEQEALLLRHLRGWKLSEIGEHLSMSRNAVARLLKRGVTALGERLKTLE